MKNYACFLFVYLMFSLSYKIPAYSQQLVRLSYSNPELLVDLAVGLWAFPLPMDTDGVPLNVYGRPSPNFADFNEDDKPDLLCGEFHDGFTFL